MTLTGKYTDEKKNKTRQIYRLTYGKHAHAIKIILSKYMKIENYTFMETVLCQVN